MRVTPGRARGAAGAATAMFCVGTLTAVAPALHHYPVYGGQAIRYAIGTLLLFIAARVRKIQHRRLSSREFGLVVLLAASGLVAFNAFIIESTRYADPATVGTIVATVPIVLALLGPLLQGRRPTAHLIVAAAIVAGGAAVATGLGGGSPLGLLLAVGALGCEVGFSLFAVPLLPRLGAIRVSAYSTAAAVPLLLVMALATDGRNALPMPTPQEMWGLAYLAVMVTAFAFLCWYDALPRLGAERAGLFSGFLPIGAVVASVILGTGHPTAADLCGAAIVIVGLIIGMRPRSRRRGAPPGPGRPGVDATDRAGADRAGLSGGGAHRHDE